jgi:hypothetical protein
MVVVVETLIVVVVVVVVVGIIDESIQITIPGETIDLKLVQVNQFICKQLMITCILISKIVING